MTNEKQTLRFSDKKRTLIIQCIYWPGASEEVLFSTYRFGKYNMLIAIEVRGRECSKRSWENDIIWEKESINNDNGE